MGPHTLSPSRDYDARINGCPCSIDHTSHLNTYHPRLRFEGSAFDSHCLPLVLEATFLGCCFLIIIFKPVVSMHTQSGTLCRAEEICHPFYDLCTVHACFICR